MSAIWESANWNRQFGIRQTGNRQFWDATMTIADFGYPVLALWCYCPKTLNYLAFQSFDFERT
jgi:hypothetical protein